MTHLIPRRRLLQSAAAASIVLPATTSTGLGASAAFAKAPAERDGFMVHPHANSAMTGIPPKERDLVTIDSAPTSRDKHRWALCHARELMPTQCISRGTGDMRKDAILRIASMTKPITSVAAMEPPEAGLDTFIGACWWAGAWSTGFTISPRGDWLVISMRQTFTNDKVTPDMSAQFERIAARSLLPTAD